MKIFLFSLYLVLLTSASVVAQPTGPPPPDPPVVPFTGLEYLLLGGGAYGIYKLSRKKNSKNNEA
jgi:hypothetical protein